MNKDWQDRALAAEAYAKELELRNSVMEQEIGRLNDLLAKTSKLAELLDDGVSYTETEAGVYFFPSRES